MVQFDHVSKRYGKSVIFAVENLSMNVLCGKIFGLIVPNGAEIKYKNG